MPEVRREALLTKFTRGGRREYPETRDLLEAWDFECRRSRRGHAVWVHARGLTLTIPEKRELTAYYQSLVVKKIRQLQLLDN